MAITWTVRNATVTGSVGHSFNANSPTGYDTYTNSRFYTSFDLSSYADADITIYGPTADGTLIRTETVPTGSTPSSL